MRNVLIFPDGSKQSFMYPENRDITVGEKFQVTLQDENVEAFVVTEIKQVDKEMHYFLSIA